MALFDKLLTRDKPVKPAHPWSEERRTEFIKLNTHNPHVDDFNAAVLPQDAKAAFLDSFSFIPSKDLEFSVADLRMGLGSLSTDAIDERILTRCYNLICYDYFSDPTATENRYRLLVTCYDADRVLARNLCSHWSQALPTTEAMSGEDIFHLLFAFGCQTRTTRVQRVKSLIPLLADLATDQPGIYNSLESARSIDSLKARAYYDYLDNKINTA